MVANSRDRNHQATLASCGQGTRSEAGHPRRVTGLDQVRSAVAGVAMAAEERLLGRTCLRQLRS